MYTTPDLPTKGSGNETQGPAGPRGAEDLEASLEEFFDGQDYFEMKDVSDKLEAHFREGVANLGRQLISDHSGEKAGVIGHHSFHGFDAAMKAAFPGWPEETDSYYQFRGHVFFGKGEGVILGNEAAVRATFKRFTDKLWPTQAVPENRFWPLLKTLADGVKYCRSDYAERKYKAEIGPAITRRGEVFDSQTLHDQKIKGRYVSGGVAPSNDAMKCRSIWVMTWPEGEDPSFYTHIGKLGRFHHSSFRAGGVIMAAGEWVIENGKLTHINACSGHYKPEPWRFLAACTQLKNKGAISAQTQVEVWWQGTDRQLLPCIPFLMNFSRNLNSGYQLYRS